MELKEDDKKRMSLLIPYASLDGFLVLMALMTFNASDRIDTSERCSCLARKTASKITIDSSIKLIPHKLPRLRLFRLAIPLNHLQVKPVQPFLLHHFRVFYPLHTHFKMLLILHFFPSFSNKKVIYLLYNLVNLFWFQIVKPDTNTYHVD